MNVKDRMIPFWDMLEQAKQERRHRDIKTNIRYGVGLFDRILWWILENELVVIAGRPWCGKSELAIQIGITNAIRGKKIWLLTLEWDLFEAYYREIQRRINEGKESKEMIKPQEFRLNLVDVDTDEDRAIESIPEPLKKNLHLYDTKKNGKPRLSELLELFDYYKKEKYDLIILDHIHYINLEGKTEYEGLSELMLSIKACTESTQIPVIAVSHLNREGAGLDRPSMAKLKGTSAIEQNANTVILLAPDKNLHYNTSNENSPDEYLAPTQVIIDKNRTWVRNCIFYMYFDMLKKTYSEKEKYNYLDYGVEDNLTNDELIDSFRFEETAPEKKEDVKIADRPDTKPKVKRPPKLNTKKKPWNQ